MPCYRGTFIAGDSGRNRGKAYFISLVMSKSRRKKITSWTQKTPRIIVGGTYRPNKRQNFQVLELRYCDDPIKGKQLIKDYFTSDGICKVLL